LVLFTVVKTTGEIAKVKVRNSSGQPNLDACFVPILESTRAVGADFNFPSLVKVEFTHQP
jgi:hypothetical protein